MTYNEFTADLRSRVKATRPTRWVRFAIVSIVFLLWVAWMGNWWLALFLFLLFDIYITGYIPFTWWKKSKNPVVKSIMSWVDAIVYALVLVYFVFAFLGQNYQIPSSSLEKTLLTGDYLFVNKTIYGPRVPMTPVNFPLVHNKLPIFNCDSYLDWPQNSYRRLPGLRSVEENDIVVFNFPAGDTVATKYEETSNYYD
ncbi:MAG: S26 family signal peptidase, partial [Muribaculaceae bacterium]|nr:S26 family signal peptidase [Muribaculaceae bacterium]